MKPAPGPWTSIALPGALTRMPSMLSDEEKQYLVWLTEERYQGWGAVVDLGPWLGSSSAALAEGLQRRGRTTRVRSFDRFVWEPGPGYMEAAAGERLKGGADFLPVFRRETRPYERWIEPRKQDLSNYVWNEGPVEILFVDAAKSWSLTNAILNGFGPALAPGRSRVVLQDFRYHDTYWLPLIFDGRPDLWREVESVEVGTTVTFVPQRPLEDPGGIPFTYSEADFPLELSDRLLRARMARESPRNAALLRRMLYRITLLDGTSRQADSIRSRLVEDGISPEDLEGLEQLEVELVPRGWAAYEQGDFAAALAMARRCTVREPKLGYAIALEGMALLRLGQVVEAGACIEEVARRLPDLPDVWLYRAELAIAERRPGDAVRNAVEGIRRHPDGPSYLLPWSLGILSMARDLEGPHGDHLASLRNLLAARPGDADILVQIAEEELRLGRRDEATRALKMAIEAAPGHEAARRLLALSRETS